MNMEQESESESTSLFSKEDPQVSPAAISCTSQCEVCSHDGAKYKCPGCSIRFCCVKCSKQHKLESSCDGKRRRTQFISISKFTDTDLANGAEPLLPTSFCLLLLFCNCMPV
eukprot:TRINITY_DN10671_c0_g1_i2.p2 TRINITY_DN10671_c0_g1~~TRINITY_DN10671_c0_g1_i2.p2  ORF type:complete len:112 (-),score=20.51 TRINITY_DN10671_c0_g1_i2:534-869(-)